MIPEFQSHKGKPQFPIVPYLKGKVFRAKKMNNSFLYHNQRMVALQNNGMLVYYSKCTDDHQNDANLVRGRPKSGVYFNQVQFSCVKVNEKEVELLLRFRASQLYNFDRQMISSVKDPKSLQLVLWIFLIPVTSQQTPITNQQIKVTDSIGGFPIIKMNNDDRTYKSLGISTIPQTEKPSIDFLLTQKRIQKKKKHVHWLDLTPTQIGQQHTACSVHQVNSSKELQFVDQWEVNDENSNIQMFQFQPVCWKSSSPNGKSPNSYFQ